MLKALVNNFEVIGVEPDTSARLTSESEGFLIYESLGNAVDDGVLVDLVTLFHVVEHFYNPTLEFEAIWSLLKPGGILVIETPNSNDALLENYGVYAFQNYSY